MRRLAALLILGLAGCELAAPDRFEPVLNVQGYLPAGEDTLRVRVNRTYAIDEPPSSRFPDAEPVISRGADTFRLRHAAGDRYLSPGPVAVRAGDVFELAVAHPGFDPVRGHTRVPGSFTIAVPRTGDTVTTLDSLVWTRSLSAAGYHVSARDETGDTLLFAFLYPNDTLPLNIPLFILARAPEGRCRLAVAALDTNQYAWLRRRVGGPGGFETGDSFPLAGGVGAFGSGYEQEITVVFRREQ